MRYARLVPVFAALLVTLTLCSCGPFGIIPLAGLGAGGGGGGGGGGPTGPLPPVNPTLTLYDQSNSLLTDYTNATAVGVDITGIGADVTHFMLDEANTTQPDPASPAWQPIGSLPTTYVFPGGEGSYTLYLWVKNADNLVNNGTVSALIEIDLTQPVDPSLTLRDRTDSNPNLTDEQTVNVESTSIDPDVVEFIFSETQATTPGELSADWDTNHPSTFDLSTGEGIKTVYMWVKDHAGNICDNPGMHQITYNTSAMADPVFHLEDLTSASSAYSNATTLAVFGDSIDIDATQFILSETHSTQPPVGDPSWAPLPLPATFDVAATGLRTVYLWIKDNAGVINPNPSSVQIEVDMTPPATATLDLRDTITGSLNYSHQVMVDVAVSGFDTDVAQYILSETHTTTPAEDDAMWIDIPVPMNFTLTSGDGVKDVYFWVKDTAGNICATPDIHSIELDSVVNIPTLTLQDPTTGTAADWCNETTVNVIIGSLDSDITGYIISEVISTPPPFAASWDPIQPASYTFDTATEETKTVYLWIVDKAGNITGTSDDITLDMTDPAADADLASGTYATAQTVTLSASDNMDPSPTIYYTTDGTDPDETSPVYAGPISVGDDMTLKFTARDAAGNWSGIVQRDYIINTSPTIVIDSLGPGTTKLEITFTYHLTDAENDSCDIAVTYSDDNGSSWYACTLTYASTGTISGNVIAGVLPGDHTFKWASHVDSVALSGPNAGVLVKVLADDGVSTDEDQTTSFTVDNRFIYVADDCTTIQDAIDAAVNGQTVVVRDGTYTGAGNVNLDFTGKAITVKSESGYGSCIIDCQDIQGQRGFHFHNGEGAASVVEGFRILDGNIRDEHGGGIFCENSSSPTIRNCMIESCRVSHTLAPADGAGIACVGSSPIIEGCILKDNTASGGHGGAFYLIGGSSATITNCMINHNTATGGGDGGGIYCGSNSNAAVTNCTIANNQTTHHGGGVSFGGNSTATVNNTIIWGNSAGTDGNTGWIFDAGSSLTLNHCCISNGPGDTGGAGSVTENSNIYDDPGFRDPAGGDYRLKLWTPCLDAGDDTAVTETEDLDGLPRISGHHVDIGAYELHVILVPADETTIQDGIDAASSWDVVLVADGTYTGVGNKNLDFGGKTIGVRSENGPSVCIIDCQNSGRGFHFHLGETSDACVAGFTIKNGSVVDENGGGICCDSSSPTITDCVIDNCQAQYVASAGRGGGIALTSSSSTIANCTITNNVSDLSGGGIACVDSSPEIRNCVIANNTVTTFHAGGILCDNSSATITNCTITDNQSDNGGGIHCGNSASPTLNNTIIWSNTAATSGNEIWTNDAACIVTLNCCDYADNSLDPNNIAGAGFVKPTGCICDDPAFRDPGSGNYRLKCGSPCFDAGDNYSLPHETSTDLDGNPRARGVCVDIGAYELNVLRVPSQYTTIQSGINASGQWDVVLVANGVYTGAGNKDLDFGGKRIAVRSEYGPEFCTIDCEASAGANARGFYFHSGETEDSAVVGLRITDGYVEEGGGLPGGGGGGVLCSISHPTIKNCIIEDCEVYGTSVTLGHGCGSAIGCLGTSHPTIQNCQLRWNYAENRGAIFCFCENTPPTDPIRIQNCLITDNSCDDVGAGIFLCGHADPNWCYADMVNCTITSNMAANSGGGIFAAFNSVTTITNCIVWGNIGTAGTEDLFVQNSSDGTTISYTDIDPLRVSDIGGLITWGAGNINADPQFLRPEDGDYHLLKSSPCIETGDNGAVTWGLDLDAIYSTQRKRIWGANVDIGCYEGAWLPVPSAGYLTIQFAINATADGDVVCVAPGTYTGVGNKDLVFGGKKVMLYANSREGDCIIDCEGAGRAMYFNSGEGPDTVVMGFEIVNGNASPGGAIYCDTGSSPTILNCSMVDNESTGAGGAVSCNDASPALINCLFHNNAASTGGSGGGGGLYCDVGSSPRLVNCTMTENSSLFSGGAIRTHNTPTPGSVTLINCVIWGNTCTGGGMDEIGAEYEVNIHYSDVDITECSAGVVWGKGNLYTDPQFVTDTRGHLRKGSQCTDAGDSSVLVWLQDLDGKPRLVGATADMGCYEGAMLLVPTYYSDIQSAIDAAADYDIVLVEDGTYSGIGNQDLMPNGKSIWIISINGPAFCTIDCGGAGRGFLCTNGEGEDCLIEGFTITNGSTAGAGGGISCSNSEPTIVDCVITGNAAAQAGGIYCNNADPTIQDCVISSNSSTGDGGGIYCTNDSYPTIINCTIMDNSATGYGGGIVCNGSSPEMFHCTITDNTALNGGGAINCSGGASPMLNNCLISNNEATSPGSGGAIYCYNNSGNLMLTNCTLANNACGWNGGGIYNYHSSGTSYITMMNCIIWGNSAANNFYQILSAGGSQIDLYSCCYANGLNDVGGAGVFNPDGFCISQDPAVDPNFPQFTVPGIPGQYGGGDFRLLVASLCIDAGGNEYVFCGKDLDGNLRVVDGSNPPDGIDTVDMGAYEYIP